MALRISVSIFAVLLLGLPAAHATGGPETPIKVKQVKASGSQFYIEALVRGADPASQVVILLRTQKRRGLSLASRRDRGLAMPEGRPTVNPGESLWFTEFYFNKDVDRLVEIFAVVCRVSERPEWGRARDYQGFGYLPFDRVSGIDGALEILRDFGWQPTGLTKIGPGVGRGSVDWWQLGQRCCSQVRGACGPFLDQQALPLGSACSCDYQDPLASGFVCE